LKIPEQRIERQKHFYYRSPRCY